MTRWPSGKPLVSEMPSASLRLEFAAYLEYQLDTAKTLGLDQVGLPISSDTIESLFGVAKRHGVGQTQDAARIALRLPALCGVPTRAEAEQVLGISVARQHEITGQGTSLTKQRREVLGHGKRLSNVWARVKASLIWEVSTASQNPVKFTPQSSLYQCIVKSNMGLICCLSSPLVWWKMLGYRT